MTNDDDGTDKDNYDDDHDYDHDQDHTYTTYNPSNCSNSCCCSLPAAVWCGPAVPPLRGPAKGYSKGSTRPRWLQELKSMIRFMAGGRSGAWCLPGRVSGLTLEAPVSGLHFWKGSGIPGVDWLLAGPGRPRPPSQGRVRYRSAGG